MSEIMSRKEMTKKQFWEKWEPCDCPPVEPSIETKREFMRDLGSVCRNYYNERKLKAEK